jgi:hypothetical protein
MSGSHRTSLDPYAEASGKEINEGRWGRSEGHIGSVKVECKSAWLLHIAAALPDPSGLGNLITQQR